MLRGVGRCTSIWQRLNDVFIALDNPILHVKRGCKFAKPKKSSNSASYLVLVKYNAGMVEVDRINNVSAKDN